MAEMSTAIQGARQRKRYFVKPDLQTKYAFMFVLAIGVGLNLGVILALLAPLIRGASWWYSLLYGVLALLMIAVVASISIVFTHKIAGPIYKIERSFRQIMDEKDLSLRIFLRTDDELQELAEEINRLLDHLNHTVMLEQQKSAAILAKLDYLVAGLEQPEQPATLELLSQLNDIRRHLEDSGLKYKLK